MHAPSPPQKWLCLHKSRSDQRSPSRPHDCTAECWEGSLLQSRHQLAHHKPTHPRICLPPYSHGQRHNHRGSTSCAGCLKRPPSRSCVLPARWPGSSSSTCPPGFPGTGAHSSTSLRPVLQRKPKPSGWHRRAPARQRASSDQLRVHRWLGSRYWPGCHKPTHPSQAKSLPQSTFSRCQARKLLHGRTWSWVLDRLEFAVPRTLPGCRRRRNRPLSRRRCSPRTPKPSARQKPPNSTAARKVPKVPRH